MKTNVRAVLGLLGIGLLAIIVGALTNHPAAASGSAPVTVVNTPLPVDVGTPSVNVANMPSVLVANPKTAPVPVRDLDNPDPAANPFQAALCAFTLPLSCGSAPNSFTVDPTVRGLVIEYVSGYCVTDTTGIGVVSVSLTTTAAGALADHFVVQTSGPLNILITAGAYSVFAQQTRIYADPGSKVTLDGGVVNSSGTPGQFCKLTLSGHMLK